MANLVDHVGLKIAVDPHLNIGALVDLVGEEVQVRSVKVSAK